MPDVHLDDRGKEQALGLAQRLAALPLSAVVSSPLERCAETAEAIVSAHQNAEITFDDRIVECRYGDWTGRKFSELTKDPLWKIVQGQPSAARFPNGESLAEISARAVAAARDWDARLGSEALWVACSHGDVIKAIVADALGLHLDQFQRIVVDPCSVAAIRYTPARPYVLRVNDTNGDLSVFAPPKKRRRSKRDSGATVGGGSGDGTV